MGFSSRVLSIDKQDQIATLWLNRPERRNALNRELWQSLPQAMEEIGGDPDVRAVILAGRGKSFCAGIDLADLSQAGGSGEKPESRALAHLRSVELTRAFQAAISSIAACPVPVIAAIHSHCVGGGVDLITACDMRLAAADAVFSVRETRVGLAADVGTLQRLPKVLNAGHVAELAYTGKDIDAETARRMGLVNDVFPDFDATYAGAQALANEIAANAPLAVRSTKFILQQSEDLTTEQSLLLNAVWTYISNLESADIGEAVKAALEKRAPKFKGV